MLQYDENTEKQCAGHLGKRIREVADNLGSKYSQVLSNKKVKFGRKCNHIHYKTLMMMLNEEVLGS